jgi:hypothetical protein
MKSPSWPGKIENNLLMELKVMIDQEKVRDNRDKILHNWLKDQVQYRIRVLNGLNWKVL